MTSNNQETDFLKLSRCRNCQNLFYDNENKWYRCRLHTEGKPYSQIPKGSRRVVYGKVGNIDVNELDYQCSYFSEAKEKIKFQDKTTDELEIINLRDALEKGIPKIDYVIDPFLRKGGITIIGGEPGSKKSFLAMLISLCIAKGEKLFDKFEVKQYKVVYLDFENGRDVIINRYNSELYGNFAGNKGGTENIFLSIFNDIKLDDRSTIPRLKVIDDKYNPDVYICDSLVRCMVGDEDRSTDVRKVFDNLKEFLANGKSFIILHHTRKDSSKGINSLRGSSDLGGMSEIVLMLKSNGKFTNVELAKHRHLGIDSIRNWGFLIDDELFQDSNFLKLVYYETNPEEQDKISQCYDDLKTWLDDNYKPKESIKSSKILEEMGKIGHKKNTVYDALKQAKDKGILDKGEKKGYWNVL